MDKFKFQLLKPKKLQVIRFTGGNVDEIENLVGTPLVKFEDGTFQVPTLKGNIKVEAGDYIIKLGLNKYQVCKYKDIKNQNNEKRNDQK